MIFQHRLVVSRRGRLDKRNETFQKEALAMLDAHGSTLVGAWEVWIGAEAGSAVYQLRQFDSLAAWEQHQDRVRQDREASARREARLYPHLDFVDTAILRQSKFAPQLPEQWPGIGAVQGTPRGVFEQRTLWLHPDTAREHHEFYFNEVLPALEREGATVVGFFDTVIGPGTTNAGSHRSIELRRFPDLAAWQRWREIQDTDTRLRKLMRETWPAKLDRVDSLLLAPTDYSQIR